MRQQILGTFCSIIIAFSLFGTTPAHSQPGSVTVEDLILLLDNSISDQTILAFLEGRELDVLLTKDIILRLSRAGITNSVMQYLQEQEIASNPATPASAALAALNLANYPSYFSSGRLGGSLFTSTFPPRWHNHNYYRSYGSLDAHHDIPTYGGGHDNQHAVGGGQSLNHGTIPPTTLFGGHQNSLIHNILDRNSSGLGHRSPGYRHQSPSHAGGNSAGHAVRHSNRHSSNHSYGNHSYGNHSYGNRSGGHSTGHSYGHSSRH